MIKEPIHVLGAGSIGILWTASIRSRFPKYPITLLLRDHNKNRERVVSWKDDGNIGRHMNIGWNNRQLSRETSTATTTQQEISLPVQFIEDPEHEKDKIKTLIVATKAHQAKQAVETILYRLVLPGEDSDDGDSKSGSSATRIIVLCNGALSVRDQLSKIIQPQMTSKVSLILATTTHGAYLLGSNELVHAGVGKTFLEEDSNYGMVDLWNQAGLNCAQLSSQEMNSMLWNKLAANCVINPMTSIFRCTNGELLMEPSYFELREEILNEIAVVAAETSSTGLPSIDEMRDFVTQTIHATRDNKSSMFQDILKDQKTEIDHLNGYVVRKGRELGLDCPANEDLCSRIAALYSQRTAENR